MRNERRTARFLACLFAIAWFSNATLGADDAAFRVVSFSADITVPIGHALMGGGIKPAKEIVDPLYALGVVLLSSHDQPIVICALDWCQLNNDAYDLWRDRLAAAANTQRERVLLACAHQHDAPIYDIAAQKMLDAYGLNGAHCDVEFMHKALHRVADAVRSSLKHAKNHPKAAVRVTHIGVGQAEVEQVASNRRVVSADGKVGWPRNSATRNAKIRQAPVGTIDPLLKTISFWDGDKPVAAVSCYSVHPMSYYGQGGVSADFIGMARSRRQKDDPGCLQIYFTGCAGDTTPGKYNDGAHENRPVLADRMYRAMVAAWKNTKRFPLEQLDLRVARMPLKARVTGDYQPSKLQANLSDGNAKQWHRVLAALGLSWQQRVAAGRPIDVPCLDLGPAQFMLMPGESFVAYQLMATKMRPDSMVMVAAFADGAPGYIPDDQNARDGFNAIDWCWVDPGVEKIMVDAMRSALQPGKQ